MESSSTSTVAQRTASALHTVRYSGEASAARVIEGDQEIKRAIEEAQRLIAAHPTRQRLLSEAVCVSPTLLPHLARVFRDVAERAQIDQPMELYVWSSSDVNACVMPGQGHVLVMLTSGAIERLEPDELSFVIGHELGHASFGHLEVPVQSVVEAARISARQSMQLLAWNRKSEISADRAGLVCCGALQVAASALFKTLSGLSIKGLSIDPLEFASQWDELAAEMIRDASSEGWRALHPFPPLRMKALLLFWESEQASALIPAARASKPAAQIDQTIERYLAMMDPLAREGAVGQEGGDPMLTDFLLWGGLCVAAANREVALSEVENLCGVVGRDVVQRALADGKREAAAYREKFLAAKNGRRRKLRALELHSIFTGLAAVAKADGLVDASEREVLQGLAEECGVARAFIDNLLGS